MRYKSYLGSKSLYSFQFYHCISNYDNEVCPVLKSILLYVLIFNIKVSSLYKSNDQENNKGPFNLSNTVCILLS